MAATDDDALPDAEHEKNLAEGWSWLEMIGGPKDGTRSYFKGRPLNELGFVDPSIEPDEYKPGDLCHKYAIGFGDDGYAVYRWTGTFKGA